MKVWIKLIKYFQGGSHVDYKYVEKSEIETNDQQQELMEDWGENTDGGHNYGYRVELHAMKRNEHPPKEWLEKQIASAKREIERIKKAETKKQRIQKQKDDILLYTELIQKK